MGMPWGLGPNPRPIPGGPNMKKLLGRWPGAGKTIVRTNRVGLSRKRRTSIHHGAHLLLRVAGHVLRGLVLAVHVLVLQEDAADIAGLVKGNIDGLGLDLRGHT